MVKKPTYEELEQKVKASEQEIVKQKQFAEERQQACEHLKQLVDQRTFELQKEATKRTQAEKTLKRIEEALRVSNEKFSAIFKSSPNAITISTLEDRRILDANERFFQLSEYSREETVGRTIHELNLWASEEESERFKRLLRKNGEVHNFEYIFNRKISGPGTGLLSASLFQFEDKTYLIAILNDITERQRTLETIRKSEQFLSAIFNSIQDGISVLDKELRIVSVNQAMQGWYGHMIPLEGKRCFEAYHMRTGPCEPCPSLRALESGKLEMDEIPLTQAEGVTGTLELFAFPMLDDSGDPTGVVEYVRDITERKRAEEAIQKAHDKLESRVVERTAELTKSNKQLKKEIMERKQVEAALRESEKKYSNLFEATPVPTVAINKAGKIVDINKSHIEKIGGGGSVKEDYIGMNILTHPSVEKAGVSELYKKTFGGEPIEVEEVYYPEVTRGTEGYFNVKTSPVFDKNGDIDSIIVTHEEVTERKQAEDALRESEEKYKSIFENVAVSIILIDADGQMSDINPYHMTHIGRGKVSKESLIGRNFFTYPTVVSGGFSDKMKRVLEGTSVDITEHYFPTTSGNKPGYFNTRAVPLFADGEVTGAVIIFEDISSTKWSEERIRRLSHDLIKSQENERQIISRELHDRVAQDLSALKISCEMLLEYKSLSSGIRKNISGISGKLNEILKAVRDLSYELRPPGLEEVGLVGTINQYCKDFSHDNGVKVEFSSAGMDNLPLKFEANINLYRLVQEGLNNVRKHADAANVKIKLISSFPNIILRIEDDGKGFDTKARLRAAYKEKRMGIRSMKERVGLLQGDMRIQSIPGKGTNIFIEIPHKDKNIGI